MTASAIPPSRSVGRFTGFVLSLVVFMCLTMIGFAGYLKFELDKAQAVLAAPPEAAVNAGQEPFDRLRRSLGYGGFLGLTQNFLATHDANLIADMKAQIKTADDIVTHLPDRTSTETRRDLQSIVTLFDNAMQKADKSTSDPTAFTAADMAPLYAALPVLDSRAGSASAVARLSAQENLQFWAMLLTLVCWGSLIIAAAMSAGIYLSIRDRNSTPLRALAQSVKNMAHGDLRTAIWGMERSDMIGELARAVDLARYHFSQLPDMSLLSDQGPVRIRFEGNTKSLFEAMIALISRDSEQVRHQAISLTEATSQQQQAIAKMGAQIESLSHNILQRGHDGNRQVQQILQEMLGSAQSLRHAQEHAADQLNRLIPYLRDRAQGMTEITQLTGKQVAQALQSLTMTERGLKASAGQSEEAIKKLASTADSLGDRLFGAINLLQASGKVLAETTESTKSRLDEVIDQIGEIKMPDVVRVPVPAPPAPAAPVATSFTPATAFTGAERLEALVNSLEHAREKLEDVLEEQTKAARAQIDLLTTHSTSLLTQSATTTQTLSAAADHLREEQARFDRTVTYISGQLDNLGNRMELQANEAFGKLGTLGTATSPIDQGQLSDLSAQIRTMSDKLTALAVTPTYPAPAPYDADSNRHLLTEIRTGFETTARHLNQMREQLAAMVIKAQTQLPITPTEGASLSDDRLQAIAAQIDTTRITLSHVIAQHIERLEIKLSGLNVSEGAQGSNLPHEAQLQMEQQTQILTELVATLGVLDAHMQEIRSQVSDLKSQAS